jgi:hypothetical protein
MGRQRANLLRRADLWVAENQLGLTRLAYKPFLTVRDVPSRGRSHRILSWTVGRQHHLFSDFEASFFYLADYADTIVDIREQYPLLPLEETLCIAKRLGVKHPAIRNELHIVTTDYVLTKADGSLRAVACKQVSELDSRRVRDKLAIEKEYWASRGIQWFIVTEREIPNPLIKAVKWVHSYHSSAGLMLAKDRIAPFLNELKTQLIHAPHTPFGPQCLMMDAKFDVEPGTGLSLVRHALSNRAWRVDMREGIDTLAPMPWCKDC